MASSHEVCNYVTMKSILLNRKWAWRLCLITRSERPISTEENEMQRIFEYPILLDKNFWKKVQYCLKCIIPLLKVLRLIYREEKQAMGYINKAMDKENEQIKINLTIVNVGYMERMLLKIDGNFSYPINFIWAVSLGRKNHYPTRPEPTQPGPPGYKSNGSGAVLVRLCDISSGRVMV